MNPTVVAVVALAAGTGARAWCTAGRRRYGAGLAVYPQGALCVLAAQLAIVTDGPARLGAVAVAAVSASWMAGLRLGRGRRPRRTPAAAAKPAAPAVPVAGPALVWRGAWIVDFAPCERCESLVVASARLESDPADVLARATCTGCGVRLAGHQDPNAPGRLVWIAQPDVTEVVA